MANSRFERKIAWLLADGRIACCGQLQVSWSAVFQQVARYFPMSLSLGLSGNQGSPTVQHAPSLLAFLALVHQRNPYLFCQGNPYKKCNEVAREITSISASIYPVPPPVPNPHQNWYNN